MLTSTLTGKRRGRVLARSVLGTCLLVATSGMTEERALEAGPGASAYGGVTALEGAAAVLGDQARRELPELVLVADLSRAATLMARWLGENAVSTLPTELVDFSLRWAGCADPSALSVAVLSTESSSGELWQRVRELRAAGSAGTHWGFGVSESRLPPYRTSWVALLSERKLELDAIPRRAEVGGSLALRGHWAGAGLGVPVVVVQSPGGTLQRPSAISVAGGFTADIGPFRESGEHVLEVMGEGRYGPEVAALLTIWVGVAPTASWRPCREPARTGTSAMEVEALLLDWTNEARQRRGLMPLTLDARLQALARAHSGDMAEAGFFGHTSPRSGGFESRFRASGWRALRAAENLSRSESASDAFAGLMSSPAHRVNLLAPHFTHIGIGVATMRGDLGRTVFLTTQIFALPMPPAATMP